MSSRPHPFELVFGELAPSRFPVVQQELGTERSLEGFVMSPAALELLRDLRPDDGHGDAVDDVVVFVHAAYLYWCDGSRTVAIDETTLRGVIGDRRSEIRERGGQASDLRSPGSDLSSYVQIPPRILWSRIEGAEFHEPLDGWFTIPEGEHLRVVACLGVHPERPGLSILSTRGVPAPVVARPDGTPAFAPLMDGGEVAGLHSVATGDELLALAWRCTTGS